MLESNVQCVPQEYRTGLWVAYPSQQRDDRFGLSLALLFAMLLSSLSPLTSRRLLPR